MKKFIFLLIVSFVTVNFLFANPIETGLASKVAKNFYLQSINNKGLSDVNLTLAYTEKSRFIISFKKYCCSGFTRVFYI